jgi:hypothetical protein
MKRPAAVIAVLVVLLAAAGCGSGHRSQAQPQQGRQASGPAKLTDLRDVEQLRSLFNTRSREPRLILLVSPT